MIRNADIRLDIFEGKDRGDLSELFKHISAQREAGRPYVQYIPFKIHGNAPDHYIIYSNIELTELEMEYYFFLCHDDDDMWVNL